MKIAPMSSVLGRVLFRVPDTKGSIPWIQFLMNQGSSNSRQAFACSPRRARIPMLPFCHVHLRAKRTDPRLPRQLKTLGDHIRKKRIELGLLQREVADLLGVDSQSVNAWERNYREPVL